MYEELYQYFIQHRQLNVPGIGTFLLQRKPAIADFPNKIINPPSFSIAFDKDSNAPARKFFTWLAAAFGITDREAIVRFNDFVFEMKKRINAGDKIDWHGVGIISSGLGGEIRFEPAMKDAVLDLPVKAEKVIRENALHTVRVGEDEKTSVEMTELLNQPVARKRYWWTWALVLALLATMFIGWYFSRYGISVGAAGNNTKVSPKKASPTSRTLQILF